MTDEMRCRWRGSELPRGVVPVSAQTYGNRPQSDEQHHPGARSHPTKSKSAEDQE